MGMQQAEDFREESRALDRVLAPLAQADLGLSLYGGQSIDGVIGSLHMFNVAAGRALDGADAIGAFMATIMTSLAGGRTMQQLQMEWLDGLSGRALRDAWRTGFETLADRYAATDPKLRVRWSGPDMSARSCITARQMQAWRQGQAIFDALGVDRAETDRIHNIAHLGVGTFGWSFANRGEAVPGPAPQVRLRGPSGAVWEWNAPQTDNCVQGPAVDFARVVTQVRHVADTALAVTGDTAQRWMAVAQCFADAATDPPAPGARYRGARS